MDGAPGVIAQTCESFPTLTHLFAPFGEGSIHLSAMDGGYAGEKLRDALVAIDGPTIEIVKRPPGVTGFVVIARPSRGLKQTTAGQWVGGRAHLRMARTLPQVDKGLGGFDRFRRCLGSRRGNKKINPLYRKKSRSGILIQTLRAC